MAFGRNTMHVPGSRDDWPPQEVLVSLTGRPRLKTYAERRAMTDAALSGIVKALAEMAAREDLAIVAKWEAKHADK